MPVGIPSELTAGRLLASEFVAAAMRQLGVLSSGEAPTGEEMSDGIGELNWLLKSFAARGANLWRQVETTVAFPAGTATVTMESDCLDVMDARFVQSSTFNRQLLRWEEGQYRQIPNRAQQGFPTSYYIDRGVDGVTMTLWPVPNADSIVQYTYSRIPADVNDPAQIIDIPQMWTEAVYLALAVRLATMFGVVRLSGSTVQFIAQRAAALEQVLLDQDRPSSVFMGSAYGRNF